MSIQNYFPSKSVNLFFQNTNLNDACGTLAKSLFENATMPVIEKNLNLCSEINRKFSAKQLAPIHLATIMNHKEAIALLHEKGADFNAKDAMGFTPLHHAALNTDTKLAKILREFGAKSNRRTNDGATYLDLFRFSAPFSKIGNMDNLREYFSAHKNDNNSFDSTCLDKDTILTDEIVATPQTLRSLLWEQRPVVKKNSILPDSMTPKLLEKYSAFKNTPPRLSIEPHPSSNLQKVTTRACGLFAIDPIKKGEIIAEYSGEAITPFEQMMRDSQYLYVSPFAVDAKKYRSAAAMANNAFPNAVTIEVSRNAKQGLDGVPFRRCLVAVDDINPGDEIAISYSRSYAFEENPVELRMEAAKKFVSENSMIEIFDKIKTAENLDIYEDAITLQGAVWKWEYLLGTEETMRQLVRDGILTSEEIKRIMEQMPGIADENGAPGMRAALEESQKNRCF